MTISEYQILYDEGKLSEEQIKDFRALLEAEERELFGLLINNYTKKQNSLKSSLQAAFDRENPQFNPEGQGKGR